jgi:hypothetical protein
MIDLNEIGKVYKIIQADSGKKSEMQIIMYDQILEILGEYDTNHFPDFSEYMSECVLAMQGFVSSPYNVTWYARKQEDIDLQEAVTQAINEGNKKIVIEILPPDGLSLW